MLYNRPSESPLEIRCMATGQDARHFPRLLHPRFHSFPQLLSLLFSCFSLFLAAIHNSHAPCDGTKGRTNVLDSLGSCRRSCGTGFELWLPMVGAGDE